MFVGQYEVRLDSKNRVIVPQKLRESGAAGGPAWSEFYLTVGPEGCVFVYTPEGWERMMAALGATKPMPGPELRRVQRAVAGHAARCELDSASRIVLPENLRTYAALTRDVVWVGAVGRAEIWDQERWSAYNNENVSQLGEMLDIVAQAGFVLPGSADKA